MELRNIFILVVVTMICCSYCEEEEEEAEESEEEKHLLQEKNQDQSEEEDIDEELLLRLLLKALKSDADKSPIMPSDDLRKQCTDLCHGCFSPAAHPVTELGCFEKCLVDGPENFECPGEQTFLDEVPKVSQELEDEVRDFFAERDRLFTARDLHGIESLFTTDCVIFFDKLIPVRGIDGIMVKIRDYFDASPGMGFQEHAIDTFGVYDDGVIWVNGHLTDYDKQWKQISPSINYMSLLKRTKGKNAKGTLQEFTLVFF